MFPMFRNGTVFMKGFSKQMPNDGSVLTNTHAHTHSQRSFCRPLIADTSEHPTTRHTATYMYALNTSSTETLQPAP